MNINKMLKENIEDLYNTYKEINIKDFDMEKARMKCLINNSITTSVKTLIQKEILDNRMQQIANIQNEVNKMIETDFVGE